RWDINKMSDRKKILIIAANPEAEKYGRLSLDKEIREIRDVLRSAQQRNQFELAFPQVAATYQDLQTSILNENPQIVHICGHGTGEKGLMVSDQAGRAKLVDAEALSRLFKLFADYVECIVLNACYSSEQAEAICQHIEYVIGMKQPIGDRSAREFAFGFYSALGNGRSYEFAYDFGCSSISIGGSKKYVDVPKLYRQPPSTTTPSLGIYAWADPLPGNSPTVLLDWTAHYDRNTREIPEQSIWDNILLPELQQVKNQLRQIAGLEYIEVQARAPLTAMLALGYTFLTLDGFQFQIEQISSVSGKAIWKSNEPPSPLRFSVEENLEPNSELLIAFSITGSAKADIDILVQESSDSFSMVYCEPECGASDTAIASNADATALAIHARKLMQHYINQSQATKTHLILYAPQGFCLFLGQKLNALGEIVAYERRSQGGYRVGVTLQTG
ncbi:MAG TPA: SAVED domain-containing protein, partial [Elainellaceae cyanobacterium]